MIPFLIYNAVANSFIKKCIVERYQAKRDTKITPAEFRVIKAISDLEVEAILDGKRKLTKLKYLFDAAELGITNHGSYITPRDVSKLIASLSYKELIDIGAPRALQFLVNYIRVTFDELCWHHPAKYLTLEMKRKLPRWLGEEWIKLTPLARSRIAQPKISLAQRAQCILRRIGRLPIPQAKPISAPSCMMGRSSNPTVSTPKPDDLAA